MVTPYSSPSATRSNLVIGVQRIFGMRLSGPPERSPRPSAAFRYRPGASTFEPPMSRYRLVHAVRPTARARGHGIRRLTPFSVRNSRLDYFPAQNSGSESSL